MVTRRRSEQSLVLTMGHKAFDAGPSVASGEMLLAVHPQMSLRRMLAGE